MTANFRIVKPKRFAWHAMFLACLYTCFTFAAFDIYAKDAKPIGPFQSSEIARSAREILNNNVVLQDIDCDGDTICERLYQLCDDTAICLFLIRICNENPELCEQIFFPPECEEGDEECEEFPDCEFGDEECEELPDCEFGDEECEEFPDCEFGDEECEEFPDCEFGDEECEEFPDCEFEDEECEEFPDCEFGDEECETLPECEGSEEECEEFSGCDFEGEEECPTVTTGYVNPNPIPNQTVMQVEQAAANNASRFLARATLGADYPLVTLVASMGESAWLETQFNQPVGTLFPQVDFILRRAAELEEMGQDPEQFGGPLDSHWYAWWTQVMTSPDLVRQRVAMALSEILVISGNVELIGESPFVVTQYYDTLLNHSFGNFRDLLKDISLTPAMAIYLSHLNNQKANPATGTFPDENYAREIMQLFSIGLFELNPDGTRKKDANGSDIPTYGQNEIREFAKIFTGLGMQYGDGGEQVEFGFMPCCNDDFYEHARDMVPLRMYQAFHSEGEKRLLSGSVVPAGQTGMQDIDAAIDNLFNHPNVGPFIGKQLIQRLVTSNPSPAYVARVTAAFNGETGSPRGDMKTVIRAILLDPEAQAAATESSGRLREPFLRLVRLARTFNATTSDRNYASIGNEVNERIKQYVLRSPSVFNFFQPNYAPNGEIKDTGLVAPEFQIVNASTIIEVKNLVDQWVDTGRFEDRIGQLEGETVSFEAELALADNTDALLDRLDTLLTYGTLSATTRNAIKTAVDKEPDALGRVKKAVYLMAISPDYAIAL